jgi:hypothetical protein
MSNTVLIALLSLGCATGLSAQCRPPAGSHEARLLAFYSVPAVFTTDPGSVDLARGDIRLSMEGTYVPTASTSLQHTEFCYTGKAEHTGLTHFLGRPRIAAGLPGGVVVEASYLPPITIAGATPNLFSAAIFVTRRVHRDMLLTFRVHGTEGTVRGPITCPAVALQQNDPQAPCYGTRPSEDTFRPDMFGGELVGTMAPSDHERRIRFSAGVGANALRPRFRVGFSDLSGGTDHTRILVNSARVTSFIGATLRIGSRCDASTEAFASFGDAVTARAMFGCAAHL